MITPRILRASDAPKYLGVNINFFNKFIRPQLTVVSLGPQMVCFDRLELDAFADKLFADQRDAESKKDETLCQSKKERPASRKEAPVGTSTKLSMDSEFAKARARLTSSRQSDT